MDNCEDCSSSHMHLGQTWDRKSMYGPSNFNPFLVHQTIPYGPVGCVPSGYRFADAGKSRENYCCGPTPYSQAGTTWKLQTPYTA